MARPREFDMGTALDGAMHEFWDHGFGNTTLPGLLKAMKLTRGSFYKAFDSKHAVYLAALQRYEEQKITPAVASLAKGGTHPIRMHFRSLLQACDTPDWRSGCFLCKASVDMAPHDRDVEALVNRMLARLEKAFARGLEEKFGSRERRARARQLTATFMGLQVMRTAGVPIPVIRDTVEQSLDQLGIA
jgi:TetR/AcrR family transcriptional regulator, transcriptional repressor for nem operon